MAINKLSEIEFNKHVVGPRLFIKAAENIIKRQHTDTKTRQFEEDWLGHFGTMPPQCVWIWNMLNPRDTIGSNAEPSHLLWALYFLRVYPTETNGRSAVAPAVGKVDKKTWRKWTHDFVEAISYLESRVVSATLLSSVN